MADQSADTKPIEPEKPERVTPQVEAVLKLLSDHKEWIEGYAPKEKRADLSNFDLTSFNQGKTALRNFRLRYANLRNADLSGLDLQNIDLAHADLTDAVLSDTILTNADLSGATMCKADLSNADLSDAILKNAALCGAKMHYADLTDACVDGSDFTSTRLRFATLRRVDLSKSFGLKETQFSGANLAECTLPKHLYIVSGAIQVSAISKEARGMFITLFGACAYSVLILLTTKDGYLFGQTAQAKLPIFGNTVTYWKLFILAPVVLTGFHVYNQLNLQNLWTRVANLPCILRSGEYLSNRSFPFLISGMILLCLPGDKDKQDWYTRFQILISIVTVWLIVPFTIGFFWYRYLVCASLGMTLLHVVLLVFTIGFAAHTFLRAVNTLIGKQKVSKNRPAFRRLISWCRNWPLVRSLALASVILVVCLFFSVYLAGLPVPLPWEIKISGIAEWFRPNLIDADLENANLKGKDFRGVEMAGATLTGANLERAKLQGAILQRAHLQDARLRSADLTNAKLRDADLKRANLQNAILIGADLSGADLTEANLEGADLSGADLQRANLTDASLESANLQGANMRRAILKKARLNQALLTGARLEGVDAECAVGIDEKQIHGACGSVITASGPERKCPDDKAAKETFAHLKKLESCPRERMWSEDYRLDL